MTRLGGPTDKPSLPPEFSPDEVSLLRELEKVKGGFNLDRMLRGALLALRNEENPESLVHAAQSARELIEKFEHAMHGLSAEKTRGGSGGTFKDQAAGLNKKWRAAKASSTAFAKGVWRGKVDAPLGTFLDAMEEFFDWYAHDDIYRKNKEAAVVIRLDPMFSALSEKDQQRIAREWVGLRQFFTGVAHHREEGVTREKLEESLARLVRYLNRRLAPVGAANKEAIRAHIRTWEKKGVTDEAAAALPGLLDSGADSAFFFANLQSPDWVPVLHRAGYFNSPPPPQAKGNTELHPVWPQSRYLIKMAPAAPTSVVAILAGMPVTKNVNVGEDIFRAAVQLPSAQVAPVIARIHRWLKVSEIRWHSQNLVKFIRRVTENGKVSAALGLLEDVLAFKPGVMEGEKPKKKSIFNWTPDPTARLDSHEYGELLKSLVPILAKAGAGKTLTALCRVLDGYIRARGRQDKRRPGYDGSAHWRPSIEDSSQNPDFDDATLLISAIRDLGDKTIRAGQLPLAEALRVLAGFEWDIFRRLEMHYMRGAPDQMSAAAWRAVLVKRSLLLSGRFDLEYGLLLQAGYAKLGVSDRKTILGWISQGPDLPKTMRGARKRSAKLEREAADWANRWRMEKLYWVKGDLPSALRRKYDRWAAKGWEPKHPGFHSWTGGFEEVVRRGPISLEGLRALSLPQQADYLREWTPSGDTWNGPSREGLAAIFRASIVQQVESYIEGAAVFINTGPEYVGSLLSALWEKLKDGTKLPLAGVWSLARWVLDQPDGEVDLLDEFTRKTRRGRRWYSARLALARLLHALLRADDQPLPIAEREVVWFLLEKLAADPDPNAQARAEHGDDEEHMGPFNHSLNTVRGEAFHAVFEYIAWCRRGTAEKTGDLPPEVKKLLERHLDPVVEPTRTIRSVYGVSINRLAAWDSVWLKTNHAKIFPGDSQPALDAVAWGVFITHAQPFLDVFKLLQKEFERAVRLMEPPKKPNERSDPRIFLGRYLVVLYWAGHIDFASPTDLLAQYFAQAPDDVRSGVIRFIGRSLKKSAGPIPSDILVRLRRLWDWRMAAAKVAGKGHAMELGAFAWWFDADKFDRKWAAGQMVDALALSRRHENQFLWMKPFAEMAETETDFAVQGLDLTFEITREAGVTFWNDEEAVRILRAGLKSLDPQVVDRAKRIQEALLREGKSGFLDLV